MTETTQPAWKALREMAGLSQREVERRAYILSNLPQFKGSGRLSVIERGLIPTDAERSTLMRVLLDGISEKAS